jgi:glycosyltransferase involved in cell wall biosynthesis
VLLVQDLWPDTVIQAGMVESPLARKAAQAVLQSFDSLTTLRAAHILVISRGMKDALTERGVPASKLTVMPNWVDESVVYPRPADRVLRRRLGIHESDIVFMYAGNHGKAQGLQAWLTAIESVQDLNNAHFVFIGDGTEKSSLWSRARESRLQRVHFMAPVGVDEFCDLAAEADAQIVSLKDSPLFRITIPGKVQSSLALESAVLGSVAGDAADMLARSGAGLVAGPEDPTEIEGVIRMAVAEGRAGLKARGIVGRRFYLQSMSRQKGSSTLASVLMDAAESRAGARP